MISLLAQIIYSISEQILKCSLYKFLFTSECSYFPEALQKSRENLKNLPCHIYYFGHRGQEFFKFKINVEYLYKN